LFSRKDARLRADTHRQAKDAKEDITHVRKDEGTKVPSECGMRNAECGIIRMRNAEWGVRNLTKIRNAKWPLNREQAGKLAGWQAGKLEGSNGVWLASLLAC